MRGQLVGLINAKHGRLSLVLEQLAAMQNKNGFFVNRIDILPTIQELIREMQVNLNLGIGYAIPISRILSKIPGGIL